MNLDNVKEYIKQSIMEYGKKIEIHNKNQKFKAYGLLNNYNKSHEQYFNTPKPHKIGQIKKCEYKLWFVCFEKFDDIDYIVYDDKKLTVLFKLFRKETGCFEAIVYEKE